MSDFTKYDDENDRKQDARLKAQKAQTGQPPEYRPPNNGNAQDTKSPQIEANRQPS